MRPLAVTVLSLVLAATGAGAENLLYCSKAERAQQTGKHESAINNWTRCINRGDLSRANLAAAHGAYEPATRAALQACLEAGCWVIE